MVRNFVRGGAAINVLCRRFGIETTIVDMGVNAPAEPGALDRKIACGAANWLRGPAMTREQAMRSIEVGIGLADDADVFGVGEMGIGNTTTAAALLCAFTGIDAALAVGRGTGVTDEALAHKAEVVRRGSRSTSPIRAIRWGRWRLSVDSKSAEFAVCCWAPRRGARLSRWTDLSRARRP